MSSWKKLEVKDFSVIYPYIKSAVQRNHYNYNLNLVESMTYYNGQLFYKIEDEVLLVARNARVMNTLFHKLLFQPIHLGGDTGKEIEALKNLVSIGGSGRIALSFAKESGLKYSYEPALSGGKEVLYEKKGFDLSGKKYKHIRKMHNRFKDHLSKGLLNIKYDLPLDALAPLYEKWSAERGYGKGIMSLLLTNKDDLERYIKNVSVLDKNGKVVFTTLYFDYECGVWCAFASMTDFSCPLAHSLQSTTKVYLLENHPKLEVIISGGWSSKGVEDSKKSLPHTIVRQVRPKTIKKLTEEEWISFKPQQTNFFGV